MEYDPDQSLFKNFHNVIGCQRGGTRKKPEGGICQEHPVILLVNATEQNKKIQHARLQVGVL